MIAAAVRIRCDIEGCPEASPAVPFDGGPCPKDPGQAEDDARAMARLRGWTRILPDCGGEILDICPGCSAWIEHFALVN
jgi:hypothetical protein